MRDHTNFPLDPNANRGRLMGPAQIRTEIFKDERSLWWVRKNVAPRDKIKLGRSTVRWYEADVYRWLDGRKGR